MITPSPTTRIDAKLIRGVLAASDAETVTIAIPDTSYEIRLVRVGEVTTAIGKRVVGTVRASARRIDVVDTGGCYVEPISGRPRRVQGRVIASDGDSVVVDAGLAIHCTPTDARQSASDFEVGSLVSFDVLKGASFHPEVS